MSQRLSRDQKRKKKLAEKRKAQSRNMPRVEPYEGTKYQAPEYAQVLCTAETAILECFMISQRALKDREVLQSLEYLVLELRGQKPLEPPQAMMLTLPDGRKEDMMARQIKEHWEDFYQRTGHPRLANSDLTGIFGTIMSSVNTRSSMYGHSQGYLHYIEKFLGKLGIQCREISEEEFDHFEVLAEEDMGVARPLEVEQGRGEIEYHRIRLKGPSEPA